METILRLSKKKKKIQKFKSSGMMVNVTWEGKKREDKGQDTIRRKFFLRPVLDDLIKLFVNDFS